ncbi:dTDP-4-dehydrorhamnose 3,5-epimerase [Pectinatus frisingensis]|uniref:dTDP-4-dehydrorhamnose 3,5-epimerase n=1 Tax=Pectinatus frisingensis TaxID=865 RepID=UPI0018C60254
MDVIQTQVKDVYIIEPKVFGDNRGWFMETYSARVLRKYGVKTDFVQDNQSYSAPRGTLRGLHFQKPPMTQAKLVRCTHGTMMDIAVDIRKGSPTYKRWLAVELSDKNKRQLYVPRGFAHGFVTLSNDVEVQYKADNYYAPETEGSIIYNDPDIGITWDKWQQGRYTFSAKDKQAPLFKDFVTPFVYGEI